MPRTAVNLPDPTQNTARGVVNNADDLLSQMAGEELDRLLSEAERHPADASGFELPAESGPDAGEASLNELFEEMEDKDLPTLCEDDTPAPAPPPPFSKAPIEAPARPGGVVAPVGTSAGSKGVEALVSAADALAAEMEEDERAHAEALRRMKQGGKGDEAPKQASFAPVVEAPSPEDRPVVAAEAVSTVPVEEPVTIDPDLAALGQEEPPAVRGEPSTPLVVRLLEWMNAPLAGVSAGMREVMGKIAIITTLNAIGVFVYVLLFRRH
jgi:hypothetical protein